MDKNTKQLLQQASDEIKQLRYENQMMSARLEVFDNVMLLFKSYPRETGIIAKPDICYDIKKYLDHAETLSQ